MDCWSGWIESPDCFDERFDQVQVPLARSPRCRSIAPRYTCVSRSGAAATYQSYQACPPSTSGGGATAFHAPAFRRHSSVVTVWSALSRAPHAYATAAFDGEMLTANRKKLAGAPPNATAVHVVPSSVERNKPSRQAASASFPAGSRETAQQITDRRCVQLVPPSVETYSPAVVAAYRRWLSVGSTTSWKNPLPTNGAVHSDVQLAPPSV